MLEQSKSEQGDTSRTKETFANCTRT